MHTEHPPEQNLTSTTARFQVQLRKGASLREVASEAADVAWGVAGFEGDGEGVDRVRGAAVALSAGRVVALEDEDEARRATWLASYALGLRGGGVHVVSADDDAARYDYEQASPFLRRLGLNAGVLKSEMDVDRRRSAYAADVTFGSYFEFCCDYLRDNMALEVDECVQRSTSVAVIHDIVKILVGMMDAPIIIHGQVATDVRRYAALDSLAARLRREEHYRLQDDGHSVRLTTQGIALLRDQFGLTSEDSIEDIELQCALETAVRARMCYGRGVDYDVVDRRIVARVGRLPTGIAFEGGLRQAIQAKESLHISDVRVALATITVQEYFRLYAQLAGVTLSRYPAPRFFCRVYGLSLVDARRGAADTPPDENVSRVEEALLAEGQRMMDWNDVLGRQRESLYLRRREVMTPVTGSGIEQDKQRTKAMIIDREYRLHLERMNVLRNGCYPDDLARYRTLADSSYEQLITRIDETTRQLAGSWPRDDEG